MNSMQRIFLLVAVVLICSSHDMFLKMSSYYLEPNTSSSILLYNGTFEKSDNVITRDRMIDVSLVGNGLRSAVDTTSWIERDDMTVLNFSSGKAGTWVAGVSTLARSIKLDANAFNDYLKHDGVLDMLEWRKQNEMLESSAVEKYSKHVKLVFQVGDEKTDDWKTILGYPIEFVPMSNPYNAKVGDDLQMKLLWKGQPLADQLIYVGNAMPGHSHEGDSHNHDNDEEHHHHDATQLRTNEEGVVTIKIDHEGHWYLRTILMKLSEEKGFTHESNWATLTFEVQGEDARAEHGHHHKDGTYHTHTHEGVGSISKYVYALGGLVLIIGLFMMLKKKN